MKEWVWRRQRCCWYVFCFLGCFRALKFPGPHLSFPCDPDPRCINIKRQTINQIKSSGVWFAGFPDIFESLQFKHPNRRVDSNISTVRDPKYKFTKRASDFEALDLCCLVIPLHSPFGHIFQRFSKPTSHSQKIPPTASGSQPEQVGDPSSAWLWGP